MTKAELLKVRKDFGKRLQSLRKQQGYSQEKFAEMCDLHRTYIGSVERGERNISLENIAKVAAALDIEISQLFQK